VKEAARAEAGLRQSASEGRRKTVRWARPKLVCEIEFRGWTADGLIGQESN
jgi:ATP-dependent DNA ligase